MQLMNASYAMGMSVTVGCGILTEVVRRSGGTLDLLCTIKSLITQVHIIHYQMSIYEKGQTTGFGQL